MKFYLTTFLFFFITYLPAQTLALTNFDVVLVGPLNTDRYHQVQEEYYRGYFIFLNKEVNDWLKEVNGELKVIARRNRRRLRKKRPVKFKDYPAWKAKKELRKSLENDKTHIKEYIQKWADYDKNQETVMQRFMKIYNDSLCIDIISSKIVLSPKEYIINLYQPEMGYFNWNEFIPKTSFQCPENYIIQGKSCIKNIELKTEIKATPIFSILNLLNDLPIYLDGWKEIDCN